MAEERNTTTDRRLKNLTYVDPLGETGKIIYPTLGTIMTLAIIFNVTGVIFMQKNRELRKHNQNLIFMIISLTELLIDVFYLFIVFWRKDSQYVCLLFFFLYTVGRHNVITHLLYLCVERLCAVNHSLNRVFHQLITIKSRLIFLGLSLTISCLIFLPTVVVYGRPSYACSPETQFGEKTGLILGINRTVFSVELIFIFCIYIYLAKKINSLKNSIHPGTTAQAANCSTSTNNKNVINVFSVSTSSEQQKSEKNNLNVTDVAPLSTASKQLELKSSKTFRNHTLNTSRTSEGGRGPPYNSRTVAVGKQRKWKMRAFKMLRCAILTTVIPSIPLILIQFLTIVKPTYRSPFLDLIVSLCNISHAIIYPLVFMITVNQCKCHKK